MTGINVDAERDQDSKDATCVASKILNSKSPGVKRKGSVSRRRKSLLLTMNNDDGDSSDDESVSSNFHRRGQSLIKRFQNIPLNLLSIKFF